MSLINQMLQDLEDRRARETPDNPMAPALPPVASPRRRRAPWILSLAGLTVLALAGALGAKWYGPQDRTGTKVEPVWAQAPTPDAVIDPPTPAASDPPKTEPPAPVVASVESVALPEPVPPLVDAEPPPVAKAAPPAPTQAAPESRIARPVVTRETTQPAAVPSTPVAVQEPAASAVRRRADPRAQASVLYAGALDALQHGEPDKAESALRAALDLAPRHAQARHALAALLIERERPSEAEALLHGEVGPAWHALRARALLKRGETERAVAELEAGLPGADADYQALLAALYQRRRRHADAVALYRSALTVRPAQAAWWAGLGVSLEGSGEGRQAATVYRRALGMPGLGAELRRYLNQRLAVLDPAPAQALGSPP